MPQHCNVNLSLNTKAHVIFEINKHSHPFLRLRQAILIILTKEKELQQLYLQQEQNLFLREQLEFQQKRQNNFLIKKLNILAVKIFNFLGFYWNPLHQSRMIELQLEQIKSGDKDLAHFLQDIKNELNTAIEIKEQLLTEYPYLATANYEELQKTITPIAFEQMLIEKIAAQILSAHAGLPESSGEVLLGLSEDKRLEFIDRAYSLISLPDKKSILLKGETN